MGTSINSGIGIIQFKRMTMSRLQLELANLTINRFATVKCKCKGFLSFRRGFSVIKLGNSSMEVVKSDDNN